MTVNGERAITLTLCLYRVYVEEERLTPEAKTRLTKATLRPYNTSVFIADIKDEGTKSNAKIWVRCEVYIVMKYVKRSNSGTFDAFFSSPEPGFYNTQLCFFLFNVEEMH